MEREKTYPARDIETGYHPDGFRIDKTTSPIYRYTRWSISASGEWSAPEAVCFHSLPDAGWVKVDSFEWEG